jgi:hypothetical protein
LKGSKKGKKEQKGQERSFLLFLPFLSFLLPLSWCVEMDSEKREEHEYPHWNRVYLAVIIYTIALIIGLWAISKAFQ